MAALTQSYQSAIAFRPERFNPIVFAESAQTKVILACFEPGQFIPVHEPGVDLTLLVLEGEGRVVAGQEEERVGPGALAFIPAGQARGIKAQTRLVLLHVVCPPPTEADHARVVAGLKTGDWR